ncbi:hypothetical protein CE91St25_16790 [Campylobacter ureolyticus]|uniref:hypothetical protein n=1 Tax=Campylobacter ureolyticus TaxID=827 RepID=UPI001FC86DE8|nr:hypothetical protein [Campylobacter ureolyticus]GKH61343.1 hypothetical protein CE91St25_16790 [Campylobacter ureolyticus]
MIFDQNLLNNILTYVSGKTKDAELLIISIFSLVIKKLITDQIAQSEKIFTNTQKEELKKLDKIRAALIQLSLEPFSKSKSKALCELLISNTCIINIKVDSELQKNLYQNYKENKTLNEELILNYTIAVQNKVKKIKSIIDKNNSIYSEFQSNPIIFYFKKTPSTIFIVFLILIILYIFKYLFIKFL